MAMTFSPSRILFAHPDDKNPRDSRPLAGWFPCRDYPQWLAAVKRAIHARAPGLELVFWTCNWGWAGESERRRLIG